MNNKACSLFEKVIEGLKEDGVQLEAAACTPVSLSGFLFYKGVYTIDVTPRQESFVVVRTHITKYSEPTEKQVKKAAKKVYKKQARDSFGRFTKKGK